MFDRLPDRPRKGRGSLSNHTGRFEPYRTERVHDGWCGPAASGADDEALPPLRTEVAIDASRTVIARNQSPDVPFDRSINPYRGCEHGCVYCFARPTHAWLGLSPGLDFETRLFAKPDAPALLERELARPGYKPAMIALGTNTDPYQPIEREMKITRGVLEVLARCNHPIGIVTKSHLVMRDLDILAPMAERGLAHVFLSVTTLQPGLARIMEPRAPSPARRLEALKALAEAGVPCGVLAAPMVPAINDDELEALLEAGQAVGAKGAGYVLLRLPLEVRDLFVEWLEAHFPDRAARVMSLVRSTRGGRDYDATFGKRRSGDGPYAKLLGKRFEVACKRLGLARESAALDCSQFRRPDVRDKRQLSLL